MTGDAQDFAQRIRAALPRGWFPAAPASGEAETAPVLMAVLGGLGSALAAIYALIGYARLQMRLSTATGTNLDLIAMDYFGPAGLPRRAGEADIVYAGRIAAGRFPQRGTRAALIAAEELATGAVPTVINPLRAADTGGYGTASTPACGGGVGWGCPGLRYGSLAYPSQVFVELVHNTSFPPACAAAETTRPAGTRAWVRIL